MAGIMFRMDGTHESVEFDSQDLASCVALYSNLAVSSSDMDLVDVRAVEQSDGSIEYTTCIYDSAAGSQMSRGIAVNKNFRSIGICIGDVLLFRAIAYGSSFDDMTDRVLPSIGMAAGQCAEVVQRFRERLDVFVAAEKCEMAPCKTLFPFLMRHTVDCEKRHYQVYSVVYARTA